MSLSALSGLGHIGWADCGCGCGGTGGCGGNGDNDNAIGMSMSMGMGVLNRGMFRIGVSGGVGDFELPADVPAPSTEGGVYDPTWSNPASISDAIPAMDSSGNHLTAAEITSLIAQAATAGTAVYRATRDPYVLPGTNIVYNPASGQMLGTTGASLSTPFGTVLSGNLLPWMIVGLIGLVILSRGGR